MTLVNNVFVFAFRLVPCFVFWIQRPAPEPPQDEVHLELEEPVLLPFHGPHDEPGEAVELAESNARARGHHPMTLTFSGTTVRTRSTGVS